MTDKKKPILDAETQRTLNAECLVLAMAGQTWYLPFDTLMAIPRVGEKIRFAGSSAGTVDEIEYEFAPETPPVELARQMPASASYARPVRILLRLS